MRRHLEGPDGQHPEAPELETKGDDITVPDQLTKLALLGVTISLSMLLPQAPIKIYAQNDSNEAHQQSGKTIRCRAP